MSWNQVSYDSFVTKKVISGDIDDDDDWNQL